MAFICDPWAGAQNWLFHVGMVLILLAVASCFAKNTDKVKLGRSCLFSLGLFCLALWGWIYQCQIDVGLYNMLLSALHLYFAIKLMWRMLPHIAFPWKAEQAYRNAFQQHGISRFTYRKLYTLSYGVATLMYPRRHYIMPNLEKVRLLISGKAEVEFPKGKVPLEVDANEFLDSHIWYRLMRLNAGKALYVKPLDTCKVMIWEDMGIKNTWRDPECHEAMAYMMAFDLARKMAKLETI